MLLTYLLEFAIFKSKPETNTAFFMLILIFTHFSVKLAIVANCKAKAARNGSKNGLKKRKEA
jgi:hypothetical protein